MIYIEGGQTDFPLFHMQTLKTSYVFFVHKTGQIIHLYYGKKLKHTPYLINLFQNYETGLGSSTAYQVGSDLTLDTLLLEMPSFGKGDYRVPGILIEDHIGSRISDFVFESFKIHENKQNPDALPHVREKNSLGDSSHCTQTLEVILKEKSRDITLHLFYTAIEPTDAIVRFSRLNNQSKETIKIRNLMSFSLDYAHAEFELITLDGMWIRERQINQGAIRPGVFSIDSKKGVSGANHNPFLGLVSKVTSEHQGDAYGFSLLYSGNFTGKLEVSPYQMTRVQMGISDFEFEWLLKSNEHFDTPEAVLIYSDSGLNGMSQNFHKLVNDYIVAEQWRYKERPILINNWEATYFDFDEAKLVKLAKESKKLGIELFVLDDGWFEGRNNDRTSLGDWTVDTKKLPSGLSGLSKKIRELGLSFGLWVEPEMVSVQSTLYEKYPEWVIKTPHCDPSYGRNQLILDLSNPQVVNYLYDSLSKAFENGEVSYVKWDMNRNFSDTYSNYLSKEEQLSLNHKYVLGLYQLMSRLNEAFPEILFEACSSGGNRFDLGMLYYMPQIWTSDNTDAIERMEIQYGTSLIYPLSTMGAHVSGRPSHQVLRSTPIETRFNVAAFGILGYELDLTKLTPFDKKIIEKQITLYKEHRKLFQYGIFYRHQSPFNNNQMIWSVVDEERQDFIAGYYQKLQKPCPPLESLKLYGLDPNLIYEVNSRTQYIDISTFGEHINPYIPIKIKDGGILQSIVNNRYLLPIEKQQFLQPGDVLMHAGLKLYAQFAGTDMNDKTRFVGDFGSRMYFGTARIAL